MFYSIGNIGANDTDEKIVRREYILFIFLLNIMTNHLLIFMENITTQI